MKVLVTGAGGFVGRPVVAALSLDGHDVRGALRDAAGATGDIEWRSTGDLAALDVRALAELASGCDGVIHAAAIAHIGPDVPAARYRAVNTDLSARLAEAARIAGVRRFVFVSSIRAQAGPSAEGVLTEDTPARPTDDYGSSKLEAERLVRAAFPAAVVLRPTLVVGPGAKGNLAALLQVAGTGLPLPVGGLAGRRSLVSVESLVAAILRGLDPALLPAGVYIVCDEPPLSLPEIVALVAAARGRGPRVFGLPATLLGPLCRLFGKRDAWERVAGSLVADAARLRATGWRSAMPIGEAVRRMAAAPPARV